MAEAQLHINLLELRGIHVALKDFLPSIKRRLVQVLMDNTIAISSYNNKGGVGSWNLCLEALWLWKCLDYQGIFPVVNHLARYLNARAN